MKIRTALMNLALAIAVVGSASADIIDYTTATVQQLSLPADLRVNQTQSDTYIRIFTEQQGVTLTTGLAVDTLAVDGTYDSASDLMGGTIIAGTVVNSYLIHVDPVTYPSGLRQYIGSITFSNPILGLMVTLGGLGNTDSSLGITGTMYWTGGTNRGLEWGGQDFFTLSGTTLGLTLRAAEAIDNIRVIEAVPLPAAVLLGVLGLGAAGLKLRKYV